MHARTSFRTTPQWRRYEFTITNLPCANDDAYFLLFSGATRRDIWIDGVQLEESPRATAFRAFADVETALTVAEEYGFVRQGEPAHLTLRFRNTTSGTRRVRGVIDGEDVFGRTNVWYRIDTEVAAGTTKTLDYVWPGRGFNALAAHGDFQTAECLVHFIPDQPPADPEKSMFGAHFPLDIESIRFARRVGFKANRMHPPIITRWDTAESRKGKWKFFDEAVDLACTNGIRILGLLYATPAWASCAPARKMKDAAPSGFRGYMPKDLADWDNYVRTMVSHYKGRITWWEVWNEPDGGFFMGRTGGDVTERAPLYAELAARAIRVAKEVDPNVTIVVGSGCHMPPENWLDPVLKRPDLFRDADALSLHMYAALSTWPEYGKRFADLCRAHGDAEKPRWHSEYGNGMPHPSYRHLYEYGTEHAKAKADACRTVKSFALNAEAGFSRFFYYCMTGSRRSWRRECAGFREWDGAARFTAGATAVYVSLIENRRFVRRLEGTDPVHACLFEGADADVVVAWHEKEGAEEVAVPFMPAHAGTPEVIAFDGTPVSGTPAVTSYPRYFVYRKK